MPRKRTILAGSYQELDRLVVAYLRGTVDAETATRRILEAHARNQIQAVLYNEGERYRRFNHARFRELVGALRVRGVLW